jgi:hypothetical protein
VPAVANAPDQLPDAVQPVEFTEDHVIVVELPVTMDVEPNVSVGAAGTAVAAVTDKVTEFAGEVPAIFAQTRVYVSDPTAVGLTVWVPLLAIAPDQLPEAVQPVVFTDDHVSVVEPPVKMDVDASVRTGAAGMIAGTICAAMSA